MRRRSAREVGAPLFPDGLPLARPATPPLARVMRRLEPSWESGIITNGRLVRELEEAAAQRLGVPHVVAISSCTSGLILTLQALQIRGPVMVPSFTFSASAHAVMWNGLAPVFAECDPHSFQVDPVDVEHHLDGAGAVLATHVFGAPCPAERLEQLAGGAGIPLVFDAAHGFGALRADRPVGGFGVAEVFSLSPTKPLPAGEGGLVATADDDLADRLRIARDYGNPGDYDARFAGLNARMSELHAATALEALEDLDEHLATRRTLAAAYTEGLADVPGVAVQAVDDGDRSTWKDFTIRIDPDEFGATRDDLARALKAEGVDTRAYFDPPVHRQTAYAHHAKPLPVTEQVSSRVLSLPMWRDLPPSAVEQVCDAVAQVAGRPQPELAQ